MAPKTTHRPNALLALALAWLIPGAGHAYIGRLRRGIIIFITITVTFWAGMAMGGVLTVDPRTERWWFFAEMGAGAHGLIGWRLSHAVYDRLEDDPAIGSPPRTAAGLVHYQQVIEKRQADDGIALVAPMDSVARAYAGVAGLLNLLATFDVTTLALMGVRGEPARRSDDDDHPVESADSTDQPGKP